MPATLEEKIKRLTAERDHARKKNNDLKKVMHRWHELYERGMYNQEELYRILTPEQAPWPRIVEADGKTISPYLLENLPDMLRAAIGQPPLPMYIHDKTDHDCDS